MTPIPNRVSIDERPAWADNGSEIENMKGLVRQYIPKKTDFRGVSKCMIAHIIEKLNNRPRKKKNGYIKLKDMIKKQST